MGIYNQCQWELNTNANGDVTPMPVGIYHQCQWECNNSANGNITEMPMGTLHQKAKDHLAGDLGSSRDFSGRTKPKEGIGAEFCKRDIYRVWEDLQRYLLNTGDAV